MTKTPFAPEVARSLLTTYGSPLYVYQETVLRQTLDRITKSIPYKQTQFHFACVTNGSIPLMQIFHNCGWGLHANSPGDVYLGLKAGFDPKQIVYSGSNLNPTEMQQLLDWGLGKFNLDSISQLQLFADVATKTDKIISNLKLGLRLNLPELTGDSRIGVHPDEFPAAAKIARQSGLRLGGLHFYRGTGTNATAAFTQVIQQLIGICQLLPDWEYLDFGGGFGYPYHHDGAAFDWEKFGAELTTALQSLPQSKTLIIEPGRSAVAACGCILATVVAVKWQGEKQLLGVDTTVANLSVPSVHGGYREIVTWEQPVRGEQQNAPNVYPTDVCGNTTYSRDYLGRNCLLPALQPGDIIAILDTGAYGYAMSSHFLHRPRPAEVLITANGEDRLIRKREDYSVLLSNQVFG
ncbi:MAG TPA: decarboxylase [Oscillatoriaceae cyanobacterium M33_DOE_052]|uniref:Decarboxylase n=1 Tax=Planktothricoides sp. SpSt-374 TaxID=2282167 RepID=A0A7C3ZN72_9CYAN|nr:decarboxylase [Oscillatoriaceae cyanobacterium M33_DOE_052]